MTSRLRVIAYRTFYRLPGRWRRRLVRTLKPTFTLGAVTIVRDEDAPAPGRILLLRQPPGDGWSLPGGLLDRGERPAECAARELEEEAGIHVEPSEMRAANPNAVVHLNGNWVDMVFETDVPASRELRIDGAEVLEAAWHRLDTLPPLTRATAQLLSYYGIGPYVDYPEVRQ